jgi:hypothetical protein
MAIRAEAHEYRLAIEVLGRDSPVEEKELAQQSDETVLRV